MTDAISVSLGGNGSSDDMWQHPWDQMHQNMSAPQSVGKPDARFDSLPGLGRLHRQVVGDVARHFGHAGPAQPVPLSRLLQATGAQLRHDAVPNHHGTRGRSPAHHRSCDVGTQAVYNNGSVHTHTQVCRSNQADPCPYTCRCVQVAASLSNQAAGTATRQLTSEIKTCLGGYAGWRTSPGSSSTDYPMKPGYLTGARVGGVRSSVASMQVDDCKVVTCCTGRCKSPSSNIMLHAKQPTSESMYST